MDIHICDNYEVNQGNDCDNSQESDYPVWGGKGVRPEHSAQKACPLSRAISSPRQCSLALILLILLKYIL